MRKKIFELKEGDNIKPIFNYLKSIDSSKVEGKVKITIEYERKKPETRYVVN